MRKPTTDTFHRIRQLAPVYFLTLLLMAIGVAGCKVGEGPAVVSERDERNYQRGKQLLREGRRQEALGAFLSVIEKRQAAPESHLEAGELLRTHIGDPVAAIYHYRKYLQQSPDSPQKRQVEQLIETATKDFAATLPAAPMQAQYERIDLLETVERMKEENLELKRRMTAIHEENQRLRARVAALSSAAARPADTVGSSGAIRSTEPSAPNTAASHPREYTVVPGDTLSHISGKVYGTASRWRDIFDANRDVLPNENSLKIGMKLRLPE